MAQAVFKYCPEVSVVMVIHEVPSCRVAFSVFVCLFPWSSKHDFKQVEFCSVSIAMNYLCAHLFNHFICHTFDITVLVLVSLLTGLRNFKFIKWALLCHLP